MKLFEKVNLIGRQCCHCGSFFSNHSLFCSHCEKRLWHRHQVLEISEIDNSKIISLFDWMPDQDRQISKLMAGLKGGKLSSAFIYYTREFLARRKPHLPSGEAVLVPCPGRRPDHAWRFASVLSKDLSLEVWDVLNKEESQRSQKRKNRKQRAELRFFCHSAMAHKHVIFIDDIVTTGATIRAARKAIGPCQSFQVWSLARRVVSLRDPC